DQTSFTNFDRVPDKNRQFRGSRKGDRKRRGVGRPVPAGKRPSERHKKRRAFKPNIPQHIIMRAAPGMPSFRDEEIYQAIRNATFTAFRHDELALDSENASAATLREGRAFHIVHVSIQHAHVHLLVEASDRMALARGMQAFGISAARNINAVRTRRARKAGKIGPREKLGGKVFADRYHAVQLTTPRQVRNCLAYVLNNWRHHDEDRRDRLVHPWKVDPYSSAISFGDWKEREHKVTLLKRPSWYDPLMVWFPKTWLLRVGWRRYGLISMFERPGGGDE
ncbi:MAG TPA: transposase, partial [Kofleriaceae bacterium]